MCNRGIDYKIQHTIILLQFEPILISQGQQVVEEIMDAQRPGCPREFHNIDVPQPHDLYDPEGKGGIQQPFLRSRFDRRTGQSPNNPRQQVNLHIMFDIHFNIVE